LKFLKLISEATVNILGRLKNLESNQKDISDSMKDLLNRFGEPVGFMDVAGVVYSDPKKLIEASKESAYLELEEAQIEVRFRSAIYMSLMEDKTKLREILDQAQLAYLKTVFETHADLETLIKENKRKAEDVADLIQETRRSQEYNLDAIIAKKTSRISKKFERALQEVKEEKSTVEKALERLQSLTEKTETTTAKLANQVVSTRSSKIFTKGKP